jgi:hypothetical protein
MRGDTMVDRAYLRAGGGAAVGGGVVGVVGNLLHPRYSNLDDVDIYRTIAASDRFRIADLLIIVALLLTVAGFVAIAHAMSGGAGSTLARFGRDAAVIGGAIAIASIALDLYGLRQAAENFAKAAPDNQSGAFWATNAIDHINTGMFGAWTIVFLGVAPFLIGGAALAARQRPIWVGLTGAVGGALCVVVGFINLSREDQTPTQIPFLVGSLLVTAWVIAAGIGLWRLASPGSSSSGTDGPDARRTEASAV